MGKSTRAAEGKEAASHEHWDKLQERLRRLVQTHLAQPCETHQHFYCHFLYTSRIALSTNLTSYFTAPFFHILHDNLFPHKTTAISLTSCKTLSSKLTRHFTVFFLTSIKTAKWKQNHSRIFNQLPFLNNYGIYTSNKVTKEEFRSKCLLYLF